MKKVNGYSFSRTWFDFAFENSDVVSSNHTALFMWLCEINNRLGWCPQFQITAGECMTGMSCRSYKTYKRTLDELIEWGFIKLIRQSKNQYQCNVIALVNFTKAHTKAQAKALTNALLNHLPKHFPHSKETSNLKPQTSN